MRGTERHPGEVQTRSLAPVPGSLNPMMLRHARPNVDVLDAAGRRAHKAGASFMDARLGSS